MDAIHKSLPTEEPTAERKEFLATFLPGIRLVHSPAKIQGEMKRKRGPARRPAERKAKYRQTSKITRFTDHYCGECEHDWSGLLDHYCRCSHDDARRMLDHSCACQHEFQTGDDHWCPCPHTLSSGFIDDRLLDEIDVQARNRVAGISPEVLDMHLAGVEKAE